MIVIFSLEILASCATSPGAGTNTSKDPIFSSEYSGIGSQLIFQDGNKVSFIYSVEDVNILWSIIKVKGGKILSWTGTYEFFDDNAKIRVTHGEGDGVAVDEWELLVKNNEVIAVQMPLINLVYTREYRRQFSN